MDEKHDMQRKGLEEEIDELRISSPEFTRTKQTMQNTNGKSSALRERNSINMARNKYIKGKVKFMPDSIIEYEPSHVEEREAEKESREDSDEDHVDSFFHNWFDAISTSQDSSKMSLGTILLE